MLRTNRSNDKEKVPKKTNYPLLLQSRHPPTWLIILDEYAKARNAGPCSTLMRTWQRFFMVYETTNVKHYPAEVAKCAMRKATPIHQQLTDMPAS